MQVAEQVICFHCGQPCDEVPIVQHEKEFCCQGCLLVYEILEENNLCEYYSLDKNPGVSLRHVSEESYAYLEEASIQKKLLEFQIDDLARATFFVPAIHCISCIWLLENLQKLANGVLRSEVNFSRKLVTIDFKPETVTLAQLARLLASLGYAPQISLGKEARSNHQATHSLVAKLAVAGFCFGNIMLLSFPEYLGLKDSDLGLKLLFSYLNVLLAIPVVTFSGREYFINAWKSFKQKQINIDVPIAVGLAALFLRSMYDILSHSGPGYLDSLTGLVFFLLIGRWFQSKTYESLAFDRDYKSYFPLAACKWVEDDWKPVVVYDLKRGDTIRVRNREIVPADSILTNVEAFIDYSFVTGESKPIKAHKGDLIYAGGRLMGEPIELLVDKKTDQSHLTRLWNNAAFTKPEESKYQKIIDRAARKFTWAVLALAVVTAMYWYWTDASKLWLIITSVLMVACPCALALAAPFTFGNMMRALGRHGFYLKNADVVERLGTINAVVFDKTGTITKGAEEISFTGVLDDQELAWVKKVTSSSAHPLSNLITKNISFNSTLALRHFREYPGKGVEGTVAGKEIKIGSAAFVDFTGKLNDMQSKVFVSIDGLVRGYFQVSTSIRKPMRNLLSKLQGKFVALLSGDNEADRMRMKDIFPSHATLLFNQDPHAKLEFVSNLQHQGKKVMMIGDGLNDSGALKQSDVGIAVTDDTGIFTPACDAILKGEQLGKLDKFIQLGKSATTILKWAFAISFFYNIIALSFAVTGYLTPLTAAILMPISSISVVGFATLAVNKVSNKILKS
ncbi:MAG: heavy metal translocating P-type ATPase metal-binding domain-containing protein [Bacteroidetes bacterium]|nr:heavy metal translocating P-type ATPase metal-binding domain-containing protein [Bacteroidota bacterium]